MEIRVSIMMSLSEGPKSPTRLMYTTNLSWTPLQECLSYLMNQGLVQEVKQSLHRRAYALTQKGKDVVSEYAGLMEELSQDLLSQRINELE